MRVVKVVIGVFLFLGALFTTLNVFLGETPAGETGQRLVMYNYGRLAGAVVFAFLGYRLVKPTEE